jgi:hypothetical protein
MRKRLIILLSWIAISVPLTLAQSITELGITDKPNVPNVKGHTAVPIPPFQAHTGPTRKFPSQGPLVFELRELIDHPFYFWPKTLLTYPVNFEEVNIKGADQLSLIRTDTGQQEPFQLTGIDTKNGKISFAYVHFLSDLPSGATRRFEFRLGEKQTLPQPASELARIDKDSIVLDTGETKMRIPASQDVKSEAPGPILQIGWGNNWFGTSRMVSSKRRVLRITTEREENGPVFVQYRIKYDFENNGRYIATIRSIKGYEFFPFHERTEGISREEGIYFETSWTNFNPTHREGPNHPWVPVRYIPSGMDRSKKPSFSDHKWEKIDDPIVSDRQGVWLAYTKDGELAFRLGPYGMRTTFVVLSSSTFWDEKTNNSIGIIADHSDAWQDNHYAIWSSSDIQHIHYFYKDKKLSWQWPIANGVRSTGILSYNHQKDIEAVDRDQELYRKVDGEGYFLGLMGMTSHTQYLRNRYAPLNLNRVKDYVLDYPETSKRPPKIFSSGMIKSADELEKYVLSHSMVRELPMHGSRTDTGFGAVRSRVIHHAFSDGLVRLYDKLSPEQRRRITAAYLMIAYQCAEDDFQPMRTMLAGNPNFMSDVKGGIGFMTFLFPDHPKAQEWADVYEKFVELNSRYMTRPNVEEWNSRGGRWTENLGSYVWAALRPTLRSGIILRDHVDGRNRLANPRMVELGDWLVNAVGAPTMPSSRRGRQTTTNETNERLTASLNNHQVLQRVYPPQGAHASRRLPPRDLWLLGSILHNYAPLKAEHMMYTARPSAADFIGEADSWSSVLFRKPDNRGTNPHLKSSKYTGHGIVLRAAVDTPEELSIHLQQIDNGPNYRWGIPGEGGNGAIYFYAGGKAYTHNGSEDAGDRRATATDYNTNFAVWNDNAFRSIGKNFLTEPMYDLELAQFAEIRAREGRHTYAYPEYKSRSVLLAGSDYFAIYDDTGAPSVRWRFSWFTGLNDPMPFLHFVGRGTSGDEEGEGDDGQKTEIKTGVTKGIWVEGMGDSFVIVTHKPGLEVKRSVYGAMVRGKDFEDMVFRNPEGIDYKSTGQSFTGTSGLVRKRGNRQEVSIFHGTQIESGGIQLNVSHSDLGVSAAFEQPGELIGITSTQGPGTLSIQWTNARPQGSFYLNGERQQTIETQNSIKIQIPTGRHRWQFTAGQPIPVAPQIIRTENNAETAKVFFTTVASAKGYHIEISSDGGKTWTRVGSTLSSPFNLTKQKNGEKIHVRVIAFNDQHVGDPADEYPIYVTDKAPATPDGLILRTAANTVNVQWGEVLGASEYRLYRRLKGETKYSLVYKGLERKFTDKANGVIPSFEIPGEEGTIKHYKGNLVIYEYVVSAVNGNGESAQSLPADTNPASWRNWDPVPGERFRYRHNWGNERESMRVIEPSDAEGVDYIE